MVMRVHFNPERHVLHFSFQVFRGIAEFPLPVFNVYYIIFFPRLKKKVN